MSRELDIGTKKYTKVLVTDEPGAGGANHEYEIKTVPNVGREDITLGTVSFQNGAIKESGVNGVMNEDLIAIVIDRMTGFQSGDFACDANQLALDRLKEALEALNGRTKEREDRGVEGTTVV